MLKMTCEILVPHLNFIFVGFILPCHSSYSVEGCSSETSVGIIFEQLNELLSAFNDDRLDCAEEKGKKIEIEE